MSLGVTNRVTYTADGSTSIYAYTFLIRDVSWLLVTVKDTSDNETALTLNTHYTVSGINEPSGGNITLVNVVEPWITNGNLTTGYKLVIRRVLPLTQTYGFRNQSDYYPESHEDAHDDRMMVAQQQEQLIDRSFRVPETEDVSAPYVLPAVAERANKFMAFDTNGNPIASTGGISPSIPVSAFMQTLLGAADAPTARTTLAVPSGSDTLTNKTISASQNTIQQMDSCGYLANLALVASVAGNALTIALKGNNGSDPSSTNNVFIGFRNGTATAGTYNIRKVAAALSVTIPDATGLGLPTGAVSNLYVYALDNAGSIELAVSPVGYWNEGMLQSTTAVSGGSSRDVLYSQNAHVSGIPARLIGRVAITLAASNHWSNAPTEIALAPLRPGKQVIVGATQTAVSTTTSTSYAGNLTNRINVLITPQRTGLYKIWGTFPVTNNGTPVTLLQVIATTGTVAQTIVTQEALNGGVSGGFASVTPYTIVQLVAGTAYTFDVQMRVSVASTGQIGSSLGNAMSLIAEEL